MMECFSSILFYLYLLSSILYDYSCAKECNGVIITFRAFEMYSLRLCVLRAVVELCLQVQKLWSMPFFFSRNESWVTNTKQH